MKIKFLFSYIYIYNKMGDILSKLICCCGGVVEDREPVLYRHTEIERYIETLSSDELETSIKFYKFKKK